MNCDVAREALSARIDGEWEPVPTSRVDKHLEICPPCARWYLLVSNQTEQLRRLAGPTRPRLGSVPVSLHRDPLGSARKVLDRVGPSWRRWALGLVGMVQLAVGAAQATGVDFGMAVAHHGEAPGLHLMNESTAWSIALGIVMIAAAVRPMAAAGLAGVLAVFAVGLAGYVVADWFAGLVTPARVLSHLPVVLGALLAVLVWRRGGRPDRPGPRSALSPVSALALASVPALPPADLSRDRGRGQRWLTDGSAA